MSKRRSDLALVLSRQPAVLRGANLLSELTRTGALIFLVMIPTASGALEDRTRQECERLWIAGRYEEVRNDIKRLRKSGATSWATSLEADYWLGTSECKLGDPEGAQILTRLREDNELSPPYERAVISAISICSSLNKPHPERIPVVQNGTVALAGVRDNGGHTDTVFPRMFNDPMSAKTSLKGGALAPTLFSIDDAQDAVKLVKRILGSNTRANGFGRFLFVAGPDSEFAGDPETASMLEEYVQILTSRFKILVPDKLITIYSVGDLQEIASLARELYGYDLPLDANSCSSAQTLSVISLEDKRHGIVKHELFHLLSESSFEDCPFWLEEGIALTYNESTISDGRIVQLRNKVLGLSPEEWEIRPSLRDVLTMSWQNAAMTIKAKDNSRRSFVLHSYVLDFVNYLQSKGKLEAVYFAMRYDRFDPLSGRFRGDPEIVEQVLGMKLPDIERDFGEWLRLEK